MINTKALTIRFGHSRFWKVKSVPQDFSDHFHYIKFEKFLEDFFSQKIFQLVGFVYGHSVIKYYSTYVRAEIFIHDFRFEEFNKNFFKFARYNFRKRRNFRYRFFRPFVRKLFYIFKKRKPRSFFFSKRSNRSSYFSKNNRFNQSNKYTHSGNSVTSNKKKVYYYSDKENEIRRKQFYATIYGRGKNSNINGTSTFSPNIKKKFFSNFSYKNSNNFRKNSFIFRPSRAKKPSKRFIFLKNRIQSSKLRSKTSIFFRAISSFFYKFKVLLSKLSSSKSLKRSQLIKIKIVIFNFYKFICFFKKMFKHFFKKALIFSFFFQKYYFNPFFFCKKLFTYNRFNTFKSLGFLPYSRSFVKNHSSTILFQNKKKISRKKDVIKNFTFTFFNFKFSSYFDTFLSRSRKKKSLNTFITKKVSKLFNYSSIRDFFVLGINYSPFTYYNYSDDFNLYDFSFSSLVTRRVFSGSKITSTRLKKRLNYLYRIKSRIKKLNFKFIKKIYKFNSRFNNHTTSSYDDSKIYIPNRNNIMAFYSKPKPVTVPKTIVEKKKPGKKGKISSLKLKRSNKRSKVPIVKKNFFFFNRKKRRRKKLRKFFPFFYKYRRLSYLHSKFFRFKFLSFVCSYFSRNFNSKFFGLPVKILIRILPAYRTTVDMFLRYFVTKLFYRYILGDILNPIVKTSLKRFRGFTVVANGRFTRAQMASHRYYKRGSVSFSSISVPIDYNQMCVPLKYGTCNVKLWMRY